MAAADSRVKLTAMLLYVSFVQSPPHCHAPLCFVCAESVVPTSGSLPTVGGAGSTVDIRGLYLGLQPSAVAVTYSGGSDGHASRTYTTPGGACTILAPGTAIRCPMQPGVGANYTFAVTVGSGVSRPSTGVLSYAPPVINSVDGPGADRGLTTGGVPVLLRGSNFGPAGGDTRITAWATPAADESLAFHASNCTVVQSHETIQCSLPPGLGAGLSWRVVVEGQGNTRPLSAYAGPEVHSVGFAVPGTTRADTRGGTALAINGTNFGPFVNRTQVTVVVPGGEVETVGCVLVTPHTSLQCLLPPGAGLISRVAVSVLGQRAELEVAGLAYAAPVVTSVVPAALGTDLSALAVRVSGSGFGPPSSSATSMVQVALAGRSSCDSQPVSVTGQDVVVASDGSLSFTLQAGLDHVVAGWTLVVTVSGQASAPVALATRPPAAPTPTFDRASNGTHYFLSLTGSEYGPSVTACRDDVTVRIDGVACAGLTMPQVVTTGSR
jgi:hypothetical protein